MDEQNRTGGDDQQRARPALGLSFPQILGGAVAAASAAVAASALGVYGTVAGAAVVSVIATIVTALATSSVQRGTEVIATRGSRVSARGAARTGRSEVDRPARRIQWRVIGVTAASTLLLALAAVTGFELLTGSTASELTAGDRSGSRTTIGSILGPQPAAASERVADIDAETAEQDRPADEATKTPTTGPAEPTPTREQPRPAPTTDPAEPTTDPTTEEPTPVEPTPEEPTPTPEEPTTDPMPPGPGLVER
ncbi:MAG: hypothetical protein GEU96_14845 [Propionibacteriales bacterium]|nr:hypothetical protein [Propionibacteriales bacterium]